MLFLVEILELYIMLSDLQVGQDSITKTQNWNHMQLRLILYPPENKNFNLLKLFTWR